MELKNIKIDLGNPLIMGATKIGDSINFALVAKLDSKCQVILYDKNTKKQVAEIPFQSNHVTGNIYAMSVSGIDFDKYFYNFLVNDKVVTDEYSKALVGKENWGEPCENLMSVIVDQKFDWEKDSPLRIPFSETIMYRLHVRGFTKHSSSKVKNKGTYLGIVEKIPYLKELGITMIDLMPTYEFNEVDNKPVTSMKGDFKLRANTLNYWGYTDGYPMAPKASYAATTVPGGEVDEFKYMIKELHKNGIEVSMEFFFVPETNPGLIIDTLRYWVMEYHIDGIHINAEDAVMKMIEKDNILSATKIFTYNVVAQGDYYNQNSKTNMAYLADDFMISARRFIKGDEDMLNDIVHKIKANPPGMTVVNYIANHNTFTLYDSVSYDRKYNEANGENNTDGADYNYSWNCGTEGETKKRTVMELRKRQIKNGLAMVLLSQGVPMIYAGDEMCNSQKGNNNPYCLDNEISWTNWNNTKLSKEIFEFTKYLIAFRKEQKILHMSQQTHQMDYKSYGLPDMSYHGTKAWYADFSNFNRHFSAMYCGKYATLEGAKDKGDLLIAYNMFWDELKFGAPSARNKKKWKVVFSTNTSVVEGEQIKDRMFDVPGRSIVVLQAK